MKRMLNRLRKLSRSTLVITIISAMLISLAPAFSFPAEAWELPDPIMKSGNWNTEMSASHINQTIYKIDAVANTLGENSPITRALKKHSHELIRGNIWADIYPYEWALENPSERIVTWSQLHNKAEGPLRESILWPVIQGYNLAYPNSPAVFSKRPRSWPSYLPWFFDGLPLGIRHPDYSSSHLYEPDQWAKDLFTPDEELQNKLGSMGNAVDRAEFWYQKALDAYEKHGTDKFKDLYSLDVPILSKWNNLNYMTVYEHDIEKRYETSSGEIGAPRFVTAYDYLGRALHYVQDLSQPAHSFDIHRHIPQLFLYEYWSSKNVFPTGLITKTDWPEGADGRYFAQQVRQAINIDIERWEGYFSGELTAWVGDYYTSDVYLSNAAPSFLSWSIYYGSGMLIKFHQDTGIPEFSPVDYQLIISIDGGGTALPYHEQDSKITVTAIADPGWQFVGWTGDITGTDDTINVTMDANKSITAVFETAPGKYRAGDTVQTTAPLNVREEPGLDTNVIRAQPAGTAGTVLSAPAQFINGFVWWHVEYDDGTVGWSSDHRLEAYIRPASRFSVGQSVVTTGELNVRSEPQLTDQYANYDLTNVIKIQPGGTTGIIQDSQEPMPRRVMGYDLWKIEYEDGTEGWSTHHRLIEEGTFAPVDLVLVLDRSGSMRGDRMDGLKDAANAVIDMLMPHDRVAVVSFASTATTDVHLTSDFAYAKAEVEKIIASGGTSFGAGMRLAVEELKNRGSEGHIPAIVFMSDGHHNTAPRPESYVYECVNLGVPIYTVGFGRHPGEVGETLLKWMAEQTGGKYLFADDLYELENVFLRFSLEATGWPITDEFLGFVSEGETVVAGTFELPYTEIVRILLNWPGSDLDLIVIRPDGTEVELETGSDNIYSGAMTKPKWVILFDPPPGTWTVEVHGKETNSQIPFNVWVSTYSPPAPPLAPSTYMFEYSIPELVIVDTDVNVDVTFKTDEEKDVGYDGVRFKFEADGPGVVTFTATDTEGTEHTFTDSGYWGPESGFDLLPDYEATTEWTLNFAAVGDYTITFSLINAANDEVIAGITKSVDVTVEPVEATITIDPETLNLRAEGSWITAYIELPEKYDLEDIDIESVQLLYNDHILNAEWGDLQNGILMVKFDEATVAEWFDGLHNEAVELTVAGEVNDIPYKGTASIRIIDPPTPRRGR